MSPGQTRDDDGNLLLGALPADRLAKTYGTPLLVVDLAIVDAAIAAMTHAPGAGVVDISYAAKALANVALFRHLARHRIGIDVCSLGELVTAERAGLSPDRLTLHGAGKTDEELQAACGGRVGTIVVDGIEELARVAELTREASPGVMLRLNVGIDAHTHAFVATGGDTKFGIPPRDEGAALAVLRANPALHFVGLHAHVGSQIFATQAYLATAAALLDAGRRFADGGAPADRLVIGGGFGVSTSPDGKSLDVAATTRAAAEAVERGALARDLRPPRLGIEPGRAIVALAGTTLYRVLAVKRQPRRTFVVVDGGVAENPRPALYGAQHHVIAAAGRPGREEEMTVCGRSCENDELGIARLPRDVTGGDLLAMCATGAYTYSMAGNYNRFPRPAVVAVLRGSDRLLARRETLEDVLRNDAS